jgi:hypothetical protein
MHASVTGFPVYLDNFAIKEPAKRDPARRRRLIATLGRLPCSDTATIFE